jgi:hypothetical protein
VYVELSYQTHRTIIVIPYQSSHTTGGLRWASLNLLRRLRIPNLPRGDTPCQQAAISTSLSSPFYALSLQAEALFQTHCRSIAAVLQQYCRSSAAETLQHTHYHQTSPHHSNIILVHALEYPNNSPFEQSDISPGRPHPSCLTSTTALLLALPTAATP